MTDALRRSFIVLGLMLGLSVVAEANSYPNAISVQDAKALLDQGRAVLIDVREDTEVALGMAEPAQWYPKSSIDQDEGAFVSFLGTQGDKEIILYCRSGKRASIVVERLAARGLKAWNMGGFQDWVNAGYPIK